MRHNAIEMQMELNSRLRRGKKQKVENVKGIASANEGTVGRNVRAKGTEKGTLYHFYCPSPVPIHPE